jgi:hypothetical protein
MVANTRQLLFREAAGEMTHECFLASVTYLEGPTMKWFPNSRRRAEAAARRRHVRPALESLESRIVPEGYVIPIFNQGVAFATQTLANAGSSPTAHVLQDLNLIEEAQIRQGMAAMEFETASYILATGKTGVNSPAGLPISGGDLQSAASEFTTAAGNLAMAQGIVFIVQQDLAANLQAMLLSQSGVFAGSGGVFAGAGFSGGIQGLGGFGGGNGGSGGFGGGFGGSGFGGGTGGSGGFGGGIGLGGS